MTDKKLNIDKDSPELDAFIKCANIGYPDWEIGGDSTKPITKDHIEIINLQSYHGRCGPQRYGDGIRIGLNKRRMQQWTGGESLGLIIHELAHAKHIDHSPAFWETVVKLYNRIKPHISEVEEVYNREINPDDTEQYLIRDPKMKTVDGRTETPFYRRRLIAQEFNRENEVKPFEGNKLYNLGRRKPNASTRATHISITPDDLAESENLPSIENVIEWFEPQRRNQGVTLTQNHKFTTSTTRKVLLHGKQFVLDPVQVTKTASGYEFIDEASRYRYATLLYDNWERSNEHTEAPPEISCYQQME